MTHTVLSTSSRRPSEFNDVGTFQRKHLARVDCLRKEAQHAERLRAVRQADKDRRQLQARLYEYQKTWNDNPAEQSHLMSSASCLRLREEKQSRAQIQLFYDQFQRQLKSRSLQCRNTEELELRRLFQSTFAEYKERALEMKAYVKEKEAATEQAQRNAVASMQNYFNDQLEMLGSAYRTDAQREHKFDLQTVCMPCVVCVCLVGLLAAELTRCNSVEEDNGTCAT